MCIRDRAISWHLKQLLNLPDEKTRRVTFNEITKMCIRDRCRGGRIGRPAKG